MRETAAGAARPGEIIIVPLTSACVRRTCRPTTLSDKMSRTRGDARLWPRDPGWHLWRCFLVHQSKYWSGRFLWAFSRSGELQTRSCISKQHFSTPLTQEHVRALTRVAFPSMVPSVLSASDVRKPHTLPWRLKHIEVGQRWCVEPYVDPNHEKILWVSRPSFVAFRPSLCLSGFQGLVSGDPTLSATRSRELFAGTGAFDFSFWNNFRGWNFFPGCYLKFQMKIIKRLYLK